MVHDDVIKWNHFPRYWRFVRGIHRSPVNSPHKGQWRGALMFSLISAWINGWINNRETGDLRRHCAHYDVAVIEFCNDEAIGKVCGRTTELCTWFIVVYWVCIPFNFTHIFSGNFTGCGVWVWGVGLWGYVTAPMLMKQPWRYHKKSGEPQEADDIATIK